MHTFIINTKCLNSAYNELSVLSVCLIFRPEYVRRYCLSDVTVKVLCLARLLSKVTSLLDVPSKWNTSFPFVWIRNSLATHVTIAGQLFALTQNTRITERTRHSQQVTSRSSLGKLALKHREGRIDLSEVCKDSMVAITALPVKEKTLIWLLKM